MHTGGVARRRCTGACTAGHTRRLFRKSRVGCAELGQKSPNSLVVLVPKLHSNRRHNRRRGAEVAEVDVLSIRRVPVWSQPKVAMPKRTAIPSRSNACGACAARKHTRAPLEQTIKSCRTARAQAVRFAEPRHQTRALAAGSIRAQCVAHVAYSSGVMCALVGSLGGHSIEGKLHYVLHLRRVHGCILHAS